MICRNMSGIRPTSFAQLYNKKFFSEAYYFLKIISKTKGWSDYLTKCVCWVWVRGKPCDGRNMSCVPTGCENANCCWTAGTGAAVSWTPSDMSRVAGWDWTNPSNSSLLSLEVHTSESTLLSFFFAPESNELPKFKKRSSYIHHEVKRYYIWLSTINKINWVWHYNKKKNPTLLMKNLFFSFKLINNIH